MGQEALFSPADPQPAAQPTAVQPPLAVRMRPKTLDELVGQEHLLGQGSPLRRLVEGDAPLSVILWGPPGSGKTTIASIVSLATARRFVQLSALNAGVKDVRAVIEQARLERREGRHTVLFIDEVHRFSKTQQDSLLGAVEDRIVTLVAATTENPYFSVVSPLLSRSLVLSLHALTDADIGALIDRAVEAEGGLGGQVRLLADTKAHLIRVASGDARKALTILEAAAGATVANGDVEVELSVAEQVIDRAALRYDRDGDAHYDVTSAFIKSMRGSDVDAALHYLARMIVAGEDPRFIARRLVIFASEDIGMADSTALLTAVSVAQAVQLIGLPEAQLNLAHAVVHLATAPKSNASYRAFAAARKDVEEGRIGSVPPHLRDAHYPGSAQLGHGKGYRYPHDDSRGVLAQQYAPDPVLDREYYQPTNRGGEANLGERLAALRSIIRAESGDTEPDVR